MNTKKHVLNEIWDSYPDFFSAKVTKLDSNIIEKIISDVFAMGPFYYYILNLSDSSVFNCSRKVLELHGISKLPQHLSEIINLIHPEDLQHVMNCEDAAILKIREIGRENALKMKVSYCFRMKTSNGSYQLFHHQALQTAQDDEGHIIQALNIHTNINHLSTNNLHMVTLTGIADRDDFIQINAGKHQQDVYLYQELTKREIEILRLIANGYSATEISTKIFLSIHTVKTHRRNILRKTQTRKSSELVKKCIEWGLI